MKPTTKVAMPTAPTTHHGTPTGGGFSISTAGPPVPVCSVAPGWRPGEMWVFGPDWAEGGGTLP